MERDLDYHRHIRGTVPLRTRQQPIDINRIRVHNNCNAKNRMELNGNNRRRRRRSVGGHLHIPSLRSVFKGRRSLFGRYCPRRGATGGVGIVCHSIPRSISLSGMSFRAATLNFPSSVALPFSPWLHLLWL